MLAILKELGLLVAGTVEMPEVLIATAVDDAVVELEEEDITVESLGDEIARLEALVVGLDILLSLMELAKVLSLLEMIELDILLGVAKINILLILLAGVELDILLDVAELDTLLSLLEVGELSLELAELDVLTWSVEDSDDGEDVAQVDELTIEGDW